MRVDSHNSKHQRSRGASLTGSGRMQRPVSARSLPNIETFESVFDAIADTPLEAANLRARAELVGQIVKVLRNSGMPQEMAAAQCQISRPRMSDLMSGRLSLFSLDALVNIASQLGTVSVKLQSAV